MFFHKNETVVWLDGNYIYPGPWHNLETILRSCRVPILKKQMHHLLLSIIWLVDCIVNQKAAYEVNSIFQYLWLECLQPKHYKTVGENFAQDFSV